MSLTVVEKKARLDSIGASEAAAVLGVDRFKTAYEVYCVKTGKVEDFAGNEQTDAGNRFEPVILDWAEEQLGPLKRNRRLKLESEPIAATCDALTAANIPVEAKTGGLFAPLSDAWGRDGSDEIPERYIVQLHVQMMCSGADVGHLAAFLGGRGFSMFRVQRSERLASFIRERLNDWWVRHVVADVPPEYDPTVVAEVQRRIIRTPNKVVDLKADLVTQYELANAEAKTAETLRDNAKAILIDALGDAEVGEYGDSEKRITFFAQSSNNIDAQALRQQHPDIAEQFTRRRSSRVLRVVKKKGGQQ